MKTAFIGTGIMGSRMAANLLKSGISLSIFNRTREKALPLEAQGGKVFETAAEAVADADIVISMLSQPSVVEEMAFGDTGFVKKMKSGAVWVDSSTVNPSFTLRMSKAATESGIRYLDAPVAGSKAPAEAGELVFLVGGTESEAKELEPHFGAMGKATKYLGQRGRGAGMKMVINQMLGMTMLAFAESVALGEAQGFDRETVVKTLLGTPLAAPFLHLIGPRLVTGEHEANFPLQWMQKDLHLATVTAFENDLALPVSQVGTAVFGQAKSAGFGEQDFAAVFEFLKG